jgi:hypothetical protein
MQAYHRYMQELFSCHTVLAVDAALDSAMWGNVVLVMMVRVCVAVTQTRGDAEKCARAGRKRKARLVRAVGGNDGVNGRRGG